MNGWIACPAPVSWYGCYDVIMLMLYTVAIVWYLIFILPEQKNGTGTRTTTDVFPCLQINLHRTVRTMDHGPAASPSRIVSYRISHQLVVRTHTVPATRKPSNNTKAVRGQNNQWLTRYDLKPFLFVNEWQKHHTTQHHFYCCCLSGKDKQHIYLPVCLPLWSRAFTLCHAMSC